MKRVLFLVVLSIILVACGGKSQKSNIDPAVPEGISTPDFLITHFGEFKLFDGVTDKESAEILFEHLDLQRAVSVYLNGLQLSSMTAMRKGILSLGDANEVVAITEDFINADSLFLTPNTTSVYFTAWLELSSNQAMVIETPTNNLGFIDSHFFEYVADVGNLGPDKGKGGKYLLLPPDYTGSIPEGYYVVKTKTYGNWFMGRGFAVDGDPAPAVESIKKNFLIYPLGQKPTAMKFVNISKDPIDTIGSMDARIYDEINAVIQAEPVTSYNPELLGQMAAIGIVHGEPFNPDKRMRKILKEAADIGAATVRGMIAYPRDKKSRIYPDRTSWLNPLMGGYKFINNNIRNLDSRSIFFFYATGISPAMTFKFIGKGSQYAYAYTDNEGNILTGEKTYKITLPANVPAKDNWSLTIYDGQTRSLLKTDQEYSSISSYSKDLKQNSDGSYDIYFSPVAPKGYENNWVQTVKGKSWNTLFRLYGPLEAWYDRSWQIADPVVVK